MPLILGVDLGGTSVKIGICDASGRPRTETTIPTRADRGPERVVSDIAAAARTLPGFRGVERAGIGAPGPLDAQRTRVLLAPNLGWRGAQLPAMLRRVLKVPVTLENDANCAALAEWTAGAGRGTACFALYTLGTGVGGGLVIGGRLWTGSHGGAAEFGHVIVDPRGPRCACGNRGCLEALASATAVARAAGTADAREAFTRARRGVPRARKAVERAIRALGLAIASMYHVLQPDRFALAGGMSAAGTRFAAAVRRAAAPFVFDVYRRKLDVTLARLGARAGWIGAALAAVRKPA